MNINNIPEPPLGLLILFSALASLKTVFGYSNWAVAIIDEPVKIIWVNWFDMQGWQAFLRFVLDAAQNINLRLSSGVCVS